MASVGAGIPTIHLADEQWFSKLLDAERKGLVIKKLIFETGGSSWFNSDRQGGEMNKQTAELQRKVGRVDMVDIQTGEKLDRKTG